MTDLARALIPVARAAGQIALDHRSSGIKIIKKPDGSPVTQADQDAEDLIIKELSKIAPGIPVVGEEGASAGRVPDISSGTFFLVDPLDGTKDYIGAGTDFTVNIALCENFIPTVGLIFAPAIDAVYFAANGKSFSLLQGMEKSIAVRKPLPGGLDIVTSSFHPNPGKLAALLPGETVHSVTRKSGALKFCMVASGEADFYPRFAPTCEWDTAAGEAILKAAGGTVSALDGKPLIYGKIKEGFVNPGFTARG